MTYQLERFEFLLEVRQHLGLNLLQTQRRERLLEEAPDALRALPAGLHRHGRPGRGGATVQFVTIDELASFSITVWPATSTWASTSRTRDLVACSFHVATVPSPWPPYTTR